MIEPNPQQHNLGFQLSAALRNRAAGRVAHGLRMHNTLTLGCWAVAFHGKEN